MSSLPLPPPTHPATTTGNIPTDSIGPLPPHLADIGTPQRQRSPVGATAYLGGSPRAGSPGGYSTGYHETTTYHTTTSPRYATGSPSAPAYVPSASPGAGVAYTSVGSPGTGPTYEQEVQSFLDQTSPARIREQTQTKLPPPGYMERANHESVTNENSPARTGRGGSYSGSPSGVAYSGSPSGAPYAASPSAGYAQQTSYTATSYVAPPVAAATYSQGGSPRAMSGSPGGYVTTTGTGPTYEQEVQSYLDQTSPARIREQTPTTLPPADYMNRAQHESVTNENSPARTGRGGGSYSGSPSGTAGGGFVGTEYVPIVAGSPPSQYSASPAYVAQNTYTTSYAASPATTGYVPGSPGIDGGSQAPPGGPIIPGEGESPRRIRAFGVPHVDPNDPGNVAASQRRYS